MHRRKRAIYARSKYQCEYHSSTSALCCSAYARSSWTGRRANANIRHSWDAEDMQRDQQLDSALLTESPQFFSGWTENDYTDAVAWSQACAGYGWQVPWRPRIPLLQAQHDKALRPAQTQTVSSTAQPAHQQSPVQAAIARHKRHGGPQATIATPAKPYEQRRAVCHRALPFKLLFGARSNRTDTAAGSASPSPVVQAVFAAPAQAVPSERRRVCLQALLFKRYCAPVQAVRS